MKRTSTKPQSAAKRATRRFSFSLAEFDKDAFGYAKLREACNFLDLPKVRQAVKQLVEAHRENQAIKAAFPAKVRKAMARLSEIRERHAELALARKPDEPLAGELAELNAEVVSLVNIIGSHRPITDRLREANERLCEVLFLTPADKWKEQTGCERPMNLSELKQAMAEVGYQPDRVHADGLTPRFAEDVLLGFQRRHKPQDTSTQWSEPMTKKDIASELGVTTTRSVNRMVRSNEIEVRPHGKLWRYRISGTS